MSSEFIILSAFLMLIAAAYVFLLAKFFAGWIGLALRQNENIEPCTKVSVVVPARNEEQNIVSCLQGVLLQDYPLSLFEVIVVDDFSEDATAQLVLEFAQNHPEFKLKLIRLEGNFGKKAALQQAYKLATGSLILNTDADCSHPAGWIKAMSQCFEQQNPVFISGPVLLKSDGNLWGVFQELEFLSLIASGAGAIGAGVPIMCNGANLGFSSVALRQLNDDAMKSATASGDDVFLMLAMKQQFGAQRITFLKNREAICETNASATLRDYINQRMRWVSKSSAYRDTFLIVTAISVFLINFSIVAATVGAFFVPVLLNLAIWLFAIKVLADLPLLWSFSRFAKREKFVIFIPVIEPLVVIYTVLAAIAGNLMNVSWKGRKVRPV